MSYRYGKAKIQGFIDTIRYKEVDLQSTKSSGPGGQNVNKRETKIQLSWDIVNSKTIPEPYKQRCIDTHKSLITDEGILRLDAQVHRTQEANKELLQKKLANIIKDGFKEPKVRKAIIVPKHVVDKRITEKKKRSRIRASRKVITGFPD